MPVRRRGFRGAGAGLSQQADSHTDRLCPGRLGGRRRPPARAGARAAARPAAHHREQAGQRGRRGDGVHGQGAGRRLYALLLRQWTANRGAPPLQGGVQQPHVVHPPRPRLRQRQPAGGASVDAVQERRRRDSDLEARTGQMELRHVGRRRPAPSLGGILQERDRREPAARSVQGRRPGDDRADGRPDPDHVFVARDRRSAR